MPKPESKQLRNFTFERSAVNEEDRTVELSFSSEYAVERWYGMEILDHSEGCVDLSRLNDGGVLLFNHDVDYVLGSVVSAWLDTAERKCKVKVRFDEDDDSEKIFRKVVNGTLQKTSTWYDVQVWEEVAVNAKSSDGRFAGPCYIAKRWMPYEASIVSVPADPTVGVGRSQSHDMLHEILQNQRQIMATIPRHEAEDTAYQPSIDLLKRKLKLSEVI